MEQKIKIGVIGSAKGATAQKMETLKNAKEIGKWIAKTGCFIITGSCYGLPNESIIGAKEEGGYTIGISPAFSKKEHEEKYKSPLSAYDVVLYTGKGVIEKGITCIRSSNAVILIGGGMGSLNEFTIAYEEGKVIGILQGSGGIADSVVEILATCERPLRDNIFISNNPKELIERVIIGVKEYDEPITTDETIINGK